MPVFVKSDVYKYRVSQSALSMRGSHFRFHCYNEGIYSSAKNRMNNYYLTEPAELGILPLKYKHFTYFTDYYKNSNSMVCDHLLTMDLQIVIIGNLLLYSRMIFVIVSYA